MRVIELTRGMVAVVDDDDFDRLAQWRWSFHKKGYATRTEWVNGRSRGIKMHRVVLGIEDPKVQVDHKNRNKLDNRKCNLRLATTSQNCRNQGISKANSSGFKGVSFHKRTGKFTARITLNRKIHNLGLFKTPEEAAMAYNHAAMKLHGDFAYLN